ARGAQGTRNVAQRPRGTILLLIHARLDTFRGHLLRFARLLLHRRGVVLRGLGGRPRSCCEAVGGAGTRAPEVALLADAAPTRRRRERNVAVVFHRSPLVLGYSQITTSTPSSPPPPRASPIGRPPAASRWCGQASSPEP